MRDFGLMTASFAVVTVLGFALNYFFVVIPEKQDREAIRAGMSALVLGDRASAAQHLTGEANAAFKVP
jgi:preprotein translocase subunit YajC